MQKNEYKNRSRLIAAAEGNIPCDLSIGNVIIFNVFTGDCVRGSVDILDGYIVNVRENMEAKDINAHSYIDGDGAYIVPGFIDTHIHIESTMMLPENFARVALPYGTTTVITDPHEAANVLGVEGVKYMLNSGRKMPIRHYVLAPSCVPSVPGLEGGGARFEPSQIEELMELPDVIGIGEVMDYVNVYKDSERMHGIINAGLKYGGFIQGHAPRLTGRHLSAYILGGPENDHECRSRQECALKQRMGMHVNLKSSSLSNYLAENLEAVKAQRWKDSVSICTDDVHAKTLVESGHINRVIREAIQYGADPLDMYRCATYNAAREYRLYDLGAVAPGYKADLQLIRQLDGRRPDAVFVGGKLVAENGKYCGEEVSSSIPVPINTIKLDYVASPESFRLPAPKNAGSRVQALVIQSKYQGSSFNQGFYEEVPVKNGYVDISGEDNLQYCAVFNRHGENTHTVALMRNFGIKRGALASTVAHDCHNLTMVYTSHEDAYLAAMALKDCKGGIAVASDGKVLAVLPLPVMGIMSVLQGQELVPLISKVEEALEYISDGSCYLLKIATIALPVLPGTLITDKGIVDGGEQKLISIFKDNE